MHASICSIFIAFMLDLLGILTQKTALRPNIRYSTRLHEWISAVFIYLTITECFSNIT